jgi:hypothetical protein
VGVALEGCFLEDEEAAVCHFVWSLFGLVVMKDASYSQGKMRCDALCEW